MTVDPPRSGLFWIRLSRRRLSVLSRGSEDRSILRICLPACRNLERKPGSPVRPQLVSHLLQRIASKMLQSAKAFFRSSSPEPVKVPLPVSLGLLRDRYRTIPFASQHDLLRST